MKFNVKPLTQKERAWLERAQKVFNAAPDRFEFLTIGDRQFVVIDGTYADESELSDGAHNTDGLDLGYINTKGRVHGVSG